MIDLTNAPQEGTKVRFRIAGGDYHQGVVRGLATTALPVIGFSVIVEITDGSFPTDFHPYSCLALPQCQLELE